VILSRNRTIRPEDRWSLIVPAVGAERSWRRIIRIIWSSDFRVAGSIESAHFSSCLRSAVSWPAITLLFRMVFPAMRKPGHSRSWTRRDRSQLHRDMVCGTLASWRLTVSCLISRQNQMELISLYISRFHEQLNDFVMYFRVEIWKSNQSRWHREFWKIW
jgi:hypothetical protein